MFFFFQIHDKKLFPYKLHHARWLELTNIPSKLNITILKEKAIVVEH